jgi:hypothetical protein
MKLEIIANPIEQPSISHRHSDIGEVTLGASGLRVVLSFGRIQDDEDRYLDILFPVPRGFRFLDEGDLLPYWGVVPTGSGHSIFEVTQGGWIEQEKSYGMLNVTHAVGDYKEWLVVSSNGCLSVISKDAPLIRYIAS